MPSIPFSFNIPLILKDGSIIRNDVRVRVKRIDKKAARETGCPMGL
jgi:hypothetical protein